MCSNKHVFVLNIPNQSPSVKIKISISHFKSQDSITKWYKSPNLQKGISLLICKFSLWSLHSVISIT
jgi:hypothetical protein